MTDAATHNYTRTRFAPVEWIQSHLVVFNVATLVIALVLLTLYIAQINTSVAAGYQMRELESHIHDLTLEQQSLEIAVRQGQSLEQVSRAVKMMGLVQAGRPEYVEGSKPVFALAE